MPQLDEAEERIAARVAEILNAHEVADDAATDAAAASFAADDAAGLEPTSDGAADAADAADEAEAAADEAEAAADDGDLDAAKAAADEAEAAKSEAFTAADKVYDERLDDEAADAQAIPEAVPTVGDPPASVEALAEPTIAEQLDAVTAVEDTAGTDPEQPELRGLPRFWFKPLTRSNR